MTSKHQQIIRYIESLPVGEKISVRSIAKNMEMSEGTAYRAIKEAENIGIVSTIERVGTIRIERKTKDNLEKLSFGEIIKIIEGEVFGGREGLDKILNRFVIGAMTLDAMTRYIQPESLVIIGNREDAQLLALNQGAAVLITGGFQATPQLIQKADELKIPLMGTTYDTFTVASLINRAMTDQLIKKKIMIVADIYNDIENTNYLRMDQTVKEYRQLSEKTGNSRFPVVNHSNRLVGVVSAKDILGKSDSLIIERIMTKNPSVSKLHASVASVAHSMIWNGLEMLPVVQDNMELIGIISRRDVMKAMQLTQRQPQVGNTFEDDVSENLEVIEINPTNARFSFTVTPQMTNNLGMLSFGVLCEVVSVASKEFIHRSQRRNTVIEQLEMHYLRMIPIESKIAIQIQTLDIGRKVSKIDISVLLENSVVAKAIMSNQLMERN
ncbi:Cobalt-dependent inorganic pyrophosphatase [Granulicatella adiacens]|uniref:DRTGG domain-containing protein n=1 Tax=Granulicatella adiacens TaxID=46124 RepID=UPI000F12A15D|nr:DRTGG domain-containing protein [Granulicatella adiacens]RKW27854.1 MAG: CBS domain-containing protein [Granulicatella sp.]UXY40627.1 DRTGG domain-containing protein [Granulicatella adiacens]VTX59008.1 Cobalt-dependent inorganic pyrophosphatase [Granulicatella adiacens]